MIKFKKQWSHTFQNHSIVVENWWDILLRGGERLIIDGSIIDEHMGWFTLSHQLKGEIRMKNGVHSVEARIGSIDAGVRTGCHIFIDGNLVGGNTDKQLLT